MLTRMIVDLYAWLVEGLLWVIVISSTVVGYRYFDQVMIVFGVIVEPTIPNKLVGGAICAAVALIFSAIILAPFLVLFDIRQSVRSLESGRRHGTSLDLRGVSLDLIDERIDPEV